MFPSESLDLQSWSWLVVCQGAWEHTFRNIFQSICQDVVFILVTNKAKQYTCLHPGNQHPVLASRERLPALSALRHTNLTRRIDPRHPGTSEILYPQKDMNSEFQK